MPLYYDRTSDGMPKGWLKMMKESIRSVAPAFSGTRMVKEYTQKMYAPEKIPEAAVE